MELIEYISRGFKSWVFRADWERDQEGVFFPARLKLLGTLLFSPKKKDPFCKGLRKED